MKICINVSSYPPAQRLLRFLQRQADRLLVGQIRYGQPDEKQDYLRRLKRSVEKYETTGNLEFLVDAANYCFLESICPLHPQAHFSAHDSRGSNVVEGL